jgi:hypothetical protein
MIVCIVKTGHLSGRYNYFRGRCPVKLMMTLVIARQRKRSGSKSLRVLHLVLIGQEA